MRFYNLRILVGFINTDEYHFIMYEFCFCGGGPKMGMCPQNNTQQQQRKRKQSAKRQNI